MNTPGHCGTVLMGFLNTHDFVVHAFGVAFSKEEGLPWGPIFLLFIYFLKFNRNIVGIIFAVLISLQVLTNTCDAPFSAASSSFIIIMVRIRSCRILFKLTFSKPFSFLAW